MKPHFTRSDLLLLATTLIWGWTFIIVKWSVAAIDPYFFVFARFLLAFIILLPVFWRRFRDHWRSCLRPGIFLGILLALAFIAQTLGLKYTTASASGFITGLCVIIVAILAALINRKVPHPLVITGIFSATVGLLFITFKGNSLSFSQGDLFTLACAVLFALQIVYTERLCKNRSAVILALVEFATVTLVSGIIFLCLGSQTISPLSFSIWQWGALLYCGILATALAYLFQTKAQQKTPTFRTAVLLATEPLFAGIFAIGLHFDPFDWKIVIGGSLIIAGMILASWDTKDTGEDRSQNIAAV